MMKPTYFFLLLLACLWIGKPAIAQKYNPAIAIMLPEHTTSDKAMRMMGDSLNPKIAKNYFAIDPDDDSGKIKITQPNEKIRMQNLQKAFPFFNLHTMVAITLEEKLRRWLEDGVKKDSMLLFITDEQTTEQMHELKQIAQKKEVRYLIGFSEVHYSKPDEKIVVRIKGFLYDNEKGEMLFHREYDNYEKFAEKLPKDDLLKLDNGIALASNRFRQDIFDNILPTINFIDSDAIANQQYDYLVKHIHNQPTNTEIWEIIQKEKLQILQWKGDKSKLDSTWHYYQGFFSSDKQQFVAFIWQKGNMIMGRNVNERYQIYSFETIAGAYYQGKWYINMPTEGGGYGEYTFKLKDYDIEKAKKAYLFNLTAYDFFKDLSVEFNPDFWKNEFFKKAKTNFSKDIADYQKIINTYKTDKSKHTYLDIRPDLISINELKNLELRRSTYKYAYEIVAQGALALEDYQNYKKIDWEDVSIARIPLNEKFDSIIKSRKVVHLKNIYHRFYSIIINHNSLRYYLECFALQGKRGNATLHFFLFDGEKEAIYEWTYFTPEPIKQKIPIMVDENASHEAQEEYEHKAKLFKSYITEIFDNKILTLTNNWLDDNDYNNFIRDEKFWQEYVFKQKNGKFLYLIELTQK